MKLIYKQIIINNFKTIKNLEINCNNIVNIRGANETGKSTIADAISYCLFGKNSLGDTHFGILPNHAEMGVCPSVEIELLADEKPINFKRTNHAEVNRQKEFTGKYKTICEVNGIDKGVKGFEKELQDVVGADIFKMLTNPLYFCEQIIPAKGELVWQKQRKLLFEISNCKTDIDIINSEEKYSLLSEPMKRFDTVGEYLRSVKSELSKISRDVNGFTDKIEQQNKNFIEIDFDTEKLKSDIESTESNISKIEDEIASEKSNQTVAKVEKEISTLKIALANLKSENQKFIVDSQKDEMSKRNEQISDDNQQLETMQDVYENSMKSYREKEAELKSESFIERSNVANAEIKLENCLNSYKRVEKATSNIQEKCETCGRPFDEKSIANAKNKFESDKATKLNGLKAEGKKAREKVNNAKEQLESRKEALSSLKFPTVPKEIAALKAKIKEVNEKPFDTVTISNFEGQVSEISSEIDFKKNEIQKEKEKSLKVLEELKKEYFELKENLQALKNNEVKVKQNDNCQKQMESLKSEHKEKLKKKDVLMKTVDDINEFIKHKCKLATEKVNSNFEFIKFKLFDYTKEGSLFECCVPTFNGVEYKDLSASTKIVCGLDIIKAFQKFHESYLPICIDNSETITNHIEMPCQLLIMKAVEENCPNIVMKMVDNGNGEMVEKKCVCSGETGRRDEDGLWTCKECGYRWKKELKID